MIDRIWEWINVAVAIESALLVVGVGIAMPFVALSLWRDLMQMIRRSRR